MFDIGFSELLLVLVVGLVVLGPKRLPIAIRTVMGWVATIRGLAANVQKELVQELKLQELQESIKKAEDLQLSKLSPELSKTVADLKETARKIQSELDSAQKDFSKLSDAQVAEIQGKIEQENQQLEATAEEYPAVHENETLKIMSEPAQAEAPQSANVELSETLNIVQPEPTAEKTAETVETVKTADPSLAEIAEQAEFDESLLSAYFPPDDDYISPASSQSKQDKQNDS